MRAIGKGSQQRLVGKDVYPAGQSLRYLGNALDRLRREHARAVVAGSAHAEIEILGDILVDQRFEAEIVGDPFAQLAHVGARQGVVEFRLSEQHELQQLVAVGLQVREQADFLQRFHRHGMRFVDQDDDLFALCIQRDQFFLQGAHDGGGAAVVREVDAQLVGEGVQDVLA